MLSHEESTTILPCSTVAHNLATNILSLRKSYPSLYCSLSLTYVWHQSHMAPVLMGDCGFDLRYKHPVFRHDLHPM